MTDPNESTERIVPKSPKKTHGDELAGLDPKQLLAGGIAAPANTSPGSPQASWEPPHAAELAEALPRFRFSELIGRGGMGAVYRATDLELDRTVAIKVLPPQVSGDPQFAERFVREARALAKLSHPNIVTIYDFGETDGGMFYIVMEQVEGSDLRHALRSGTITLEIALKVVPQICDALQYAHQKGIVHRDIKPENILLEPDGRVKIADFGLARVVNSQLPEWSLTATEQLMGTVKYMAPEQLEGAPDIDHRADIYSLGVVFYEMLTGELPIGRFSSPSEKRPMDQRVDSVVFKTLEKERDKRYQHAGDVKSDVENLSHEPPPLPESAAVPAPVANNLALSSKSQSNVNSRLSRKALVGTLWSLALLPALFASIIFFVPAQLVSQPNGAVASRPSWLIISVTLAFIGLGVTSIVGTPLLGSMAIRDIRRSGGKLYGLRLALADLLLYPIVLVDLLILAVVGGTVALVLSVLVGGSLGGMEMILILVILGLPILAIVDFLIIRWAWRKVRTPLIEESNSLE